MILISYYEKECWVINNCINYVTHAMDKLNIQYRLTHGNDVQKNYNGEKLVLTLHPTSQILPDLEKYKALPARTVWWDFESPYEIDTVRKGLPYFDMVFTFCRNSQISLNDTKVIRLPTASDTTVYYPQNVDDKYKCDTVFIGNAFPSRIAYFKMLHGQKYKKDLVIIGVGYPQEIKDLYTVKDEIISPEECAKWYNGAKEVIEMAREQGDVDLGQNSQGITPDYIPIRHWDILASHEHDEEKRYEMSFIKLVIDYIIPLI